MFFKAPDDSIHFLSAEDIAAGVNVITEYVYDGDGEQVLNDDGTHAFTILEGPNRALAMLPAGSVEIDDAEAEAATYVAPTPEEIEAALMGQVQGLLDAKARGMGYDSMAVAVTYAEEPAVARYQKEGQKLRAWRSKVWDTATTIAADVAAGKREWPALEDIPGLMPNY